MKRGSLPLSAVLLIALAVVGTGCRRADAPAAEAPGSPVVSELASAGPAAAIYFPSVSGLLEPEMRPAPTDLDRAQRNLWLAQQLAAGPETSELRRCLPEGTEATGIFAAPDGTLFVDFSLARESVGMGSREELLSLYSVINTLVTDDPAADRAVILINGRQRETLAGHIDTSRPLSARLDLVREAG